MSTSAIPIFQISQTSTHVHLQIQSEGCTSECVPRAVVDSGNVFDGSASLGQNQQESSIVLKKAGSKIIVDLAKQKPGEEVRNLQDLKPSVFPLLEDDDEGRNEERLFGLAMLQRGVEAMRSQGNLSAAESEEVISGKLVQSAPRSPRLPKSAKTKIHECFSEANLDADERANRKVAAYEKEEKHWDEGMYLDNYVDEDGEVEHLIRAALKRPSVADELKQTGTTSPVLQRDVHLLLLELLLAQAYDYRTTLGDSTVESSWTICSLCRSLVSSCLPSSQSSDTVSSIVIGSIRRQLSFPLYRNWKLSTQVCKDIIISLRLPCCRSLLLTIRRLLENETEDEAMQVYLADVVEPLISNFDQYYSTVSLTQLADEVEEVVKSVTKNQVGGNWDMEDLEVAAQEALQQGERGYV